MLKECLYCQGGITKSQYKDRFPCEDCGGSGYIFVCEQCGEQYPGDPCEDFDICDECENENELIEAEKEQTAEELQTYINNEFYLINNGLK